MYSRVDKFFHRGRLIVGWSEDLLYFFEKCLPMLTLVKM